MVSRRVALSCYTTRFDIGGWFDKFAARCGGARDTLKCTVIESWCLNLA